MHKIHHFQQHFDDPERDQDSDGHLVTSCLVVLGLFAKIKTKKGKWRSVPIDPNYFVNSPLGIKLLRAKIDLETEESNTILSEQLLEEMKFAEENPYSHTTKSGITLKIHYKSYLTMVKSKITLLVASTLFSKLTNIHFQAISGTNLSINIGK